MTGGLWTALRAFLPLGSVVVGSLSGVAYAYNCIYLFLSYLYYLLIVLQPMSFVLLGFGAILLPAPRLRRIGITMFALGLMATYVLPYTVNSSIPAVAQEISQLKYNVNNQMNYGVLYLKSYPYSVVEFKVSSSNGSGLYLADNHIYSGYAIYQVDEYGERIVVVPNGYYKPMKIIIGYAEFELNNTKPCMSQRGWECSSPRRVTRRSIDDICITSIQLDYSQST